MPLPPWIADAPHKDILVAVAQICARKPKPRTCRRPILQCRDEPPDHRQLSWTTTTTLNRLRRRCVCLHDRFKFIHKIAVVAGDGFDGILAGMICLSRQATRGSQKSVRPTANPISLARWRR